MNTCRCRRTHIHIASLSCRLVCETATPVSVVNDIAKAYSWAKFLEAHFYTKETRSSCNHASLVDRIRYFAYKVSVVA